MRPRDAAVDLLWATFERKRSTSPGFRSEHLTKFNTAGQLASSGLWRAGAQRARCAGKPDDHQRKRILPAFSTTHDPTNGPGATVNLSVTGPRRGDHQHTSRPARSHSAPGERSNAGSNQSLREPMALSDTVQFFLVRFTVECATVTLVEDTGQSSRYQPPLPARLNRTLDRRLPIAAFGRHLSMVTGQASFRCWRNDITRGGQPPRTISVAYLNEPGPHPSAPT